MRRVLPARWPHGRHLGRPRALLPANNAAVRARARVFVWTDAFASLGAELRGQRVAPRLTLAHLRRVGALPSPQPCQRVLPASGAAVRAVSHLDSIRIFLTATDAERLSTRSGHADPLPPNPFLDLQHPQAGRGPPPPPPRGEGAAALGHSPRSRGPVTELDPNPRWTSSRGSASGRPQRAFSPVGEKMTGQAFISSLSQSSPVSVTAEQIYISSSTVRPHAARGPPRSPFSCAFR